MYEMNKKHTIKKDDYKASALPLMITVFYYWIALLIYSVYLYVATGNLGVPFIILNVGLIIYGISNIFLRKKQ